MKQSTPSKQYLEHLDYYKKMHKEGFSYSNGVFLNGHEAYNGSMTITYAKFIKNILKKNNSNHTPIEIDDKISNYI